MWLTRPFLMCGQVHQQYVPTPGGPRRGCHIESQRHAISAKINRCYHFVVIGKALIFSGYTSDRRSSLRPANVRDVGAGGSNPLTPTRFFLHSQIVRGPPRPALFLLSQCCHRKLRRHGHYSQARQEMAGPSQTPKLHSCISHLCHVS
jgi:hypothetical protein